MGIIYFKKIEIFRMAKQGNKHDLDQWIE